MRLISCIKPLFMIAMIAIVSCEEKEQETTTESGEQLLEDYYSLLCNYYSSQECAIEIGQCGQPVTAFSDWAQCMNAQNNRTSLCGQLPAIIEEQPQAILACIEKLEIATCTTAEVCGGGGGHLFYDGDCGAVEETIIQNCNMF